MVSRTVHSKVKNVLVRKIVEEKTTFECRTITDVMDNILQLPQLSNTDAIEWMADLYAFI